MALTVDKFKSLPTTTRVKIIASIHGHGYAIGTIGTLSSLGSLHRIFKPTDANVPCNGCYVCHDEVDLEHTSRNDKIKDLKSRKAKAEEELIKLTHELEVATKYKDRLDELADALHKLLEAPIKKGKLDRSIIYKSLIELGVAKDVERNPVGKI